MSMTNESNELARRAELDLAEEIRETVKIQEEAIKQQMARKYNKKVNAQEFEEACLVLKRWSYKRNPKEREN